MSRWLSVASRSETGESVLNIPREASVAVNGGRVDDEYVVRPGDEIEFLKSVGVKGQHA